MEERRLEAVEVRRHAATGLWGLPTRVCGDDCLAGCSELGVADLVRRDPGDCGDPHEVFPLERGVRRRDAETGALTGEPCVRFGAVAAGDAPETELEAAEDHRVDGEVTGKHQLRTERTGFSDGVELLCPAQPLEAAGSRSLRAKRLRCLDGGTPSLLADGLHRHDIGLDEIDVVIGERPGGGHYRLPRSWASIASAARRYSPASQSFARWR